MNRFIVTAIYGHRSDSSELYLPPQPWPCITGPWLLNTKLSNWLYDSLVNGLHDLSVTGLHDPSVTGLHDPSVNGLHDPSVTRLHVSSVNQSIIRLIGQSIVRLIGQWIVQLTGQSIVRSIYNQFIVHHGQLQSSSLSGSHLCVVLRGPEINNSLHSPAPRPPHIWAIHPFPHALFGRG